MNKNTVAANLREIAMRVTDEDIAGLILKAANHCDELRIDRDVSERLMHHIERRSKDDVPPIIETIAVEVIGLRDDLKRYERSVKELQKALISPKQPTDGLPPFELDEHGMLKRNA